MSFLACRGISPCPPLPAAGDDLKRDLAGIPLLFVMRDDLKRDMAQIPLLFVCLLEFCWDIGPGEPKEEYTHGQGECDGGCYPRGC